MFISGIVLTKSLDPVPDPVVLTEFTVNSNLSSHPKLEALSYIDILSPFCILKGNITLSNLDAAVQASSDVESNVIPKVL